MRMISVSTQLPLPPVLEPRRAREDPAMTPSRVPMIMPSRTAMSAPSRDCRVPHTTRV